MPGVFRLQDWALHGFAAACAGVRTRVSQNLPSHARMSEFRIGCRSTQPSQPIPASTNTLPLFAHCHAAGFQSVSHSGAFEGIRLRCPSKTMRAVLPGEWTDEFPLFEVAQLWLQPCVFTAWPFDDDENASIARADAASSETAAFQEDHDARKNVGHWQHCFGSYRSGGGECHRLRWL